MTLLQQWANNIGATSPINGSWIEAIAQAYQAPKKTGDRLADIAIKLRVDINNSTGDYYQDIAYRLRAGSKPFNGSWLGRIVKLTQ